MILFHNWYSLIHNFLFTEPQIMKNSCFYTDFKRKLNIFQRVIIFLIIQYRFVPYVVEYIIKEFKQEVT